MGTNHSHQTQTSSQPVSDYTSGLFPIRPASDSYDCLYKLVVMGDAETGKTCCLEKFAASDVFHTTYTPTIGIEFRIRDVLLDGTRIKLQIWETAGRETFRTLSETFYRGSQGLVAIYDTTRQDSFASIPHWIEKARRQGHPEAPVMLVGNKCDKIESKEVCYETTKAFADEHNFIFFEVSAKDGTNTEFALMSLVARIREKHCQSEPNM